MHFRIEEEVLLRTGSSSGPSTPRQSLASRPNTGRYEPRRLRFRRDGFPRFSSGLGREAGRSRSLRRARAFPDDRGRPGRAQLESCSSCRGSRSKPLGHRPKWVETPMGTWAIPRHDGVVPYRAKGAARSPIGSASTHPGATARIPSPLGAGRPRGNRLREPAGPVRSWAPALAERSGLVWWSPCARSPASRSSKPSRPATRT